MVVRFDTDQPAGRPVREQREGAQPRLSLHAEAQTTPPAARPSDLEDGRA